MQHRIVPFPFGALEGDLVLRLHLAPGDDPGEVALYLKSTYVRASFSEVWLDAPALSGVRGRELGLALRGAGWSTVVTAGIDCKAWPTTPGRIVLDVSEMLATEIGDPIQWRDDVSKAAARLPQVDEVFALAPAAGALIPDNLTTLETLLAPGDGCTVYVAGEAEQAAAVDACSRHGRPWSIRRLGPLQVSERAPAA